MRPAVLVIAGSDSSGGAGVEADLKALDHIGVHGTAAITCITAQNSTAVRSVYPMSPGAVLDQAAAVLDDLEVQAVKCGMLYSVPIIKAVADLVEDRGLPCIVDPVLAATSGGALVKDGGADAYLRHLIPRAWAVTPNAHEAEALLGRPVGDGAGAARAGRALVGLGAAAAVVKGGHLHTKGPVVDTLAVREGGKGARIERAQAPRLKGPFHGAGCHFASFMAGFAAMGAPQDRAFRLAHAALQQMLLGAEAPGAGPRFLAAPAHRFIVAGGLKRPRLEMALDLAESVAALCALLPRTAVPEVGTNFAYGIARPRGPEDVCAVDGRIVVSGGRPAPAGPIRFGGSRHVARILVACGGAAPEVRAVCNLRPSPRLLAAARRGRLTVASFDRANEPRGRKVKTMSWGTAEAIRAFGRTPDIIVDGGGPGKEPMARVLGRTPSDVVAKVRKLV